MCVLFPPRASAHKTEWLNCVSLVPGAAGGPAERGGVSTDQSSFPPGREQAQTPAVPHAVPLRLTEEKRTPLGSAQSNVWFLSYRKRNPSGRFVVVSFALQT